MSHSSFAACLRTGRVRHRPPRLAPRASKNLSPGMVLVRSGTPLQIRQPGLDNAPELRSLSGAPRGKLNCRMLFLFDRASFGNPHPAGLRLSEHSNRTNPKRRPSKIRYAEPLACQGGKGLSETPPHPTKGGVTGRDNGASPPRRFALAIASPAGTGARS